MISLFNKPLSKLSLAVLNLLLKFTTHDKKFIEKYARKDQTKYINNNNLSLFTFILLSLLAVSISNSFYTQLKEKLNNPFASVILVRNDAKWSLQKLKYNFLETDSLRTRFSINNIYETKNISLEIKEKNSGLLLTETGRVLDGSDDIYELLKNDALVYNQDMEIFSAESEEKSYGLYVTESFLHKIKYSPQDKFIELNNSGISLTLPILGINNNIPGDKFLISNLCHRYISDGSETIYKKRNYLELANIAPNEKKLLKEAFINYLLENKIKHDKDKIYYGEGDLLRITLEDISQNYAYFENILTDFKASNFGKDFNHIKLIYYPEDYEDFRNSLSNKPIKSYPEWFNIQRTSLKNTQDLKDYLTKYNLITEYDRISTQKDYNDISNLLLFLLGFILFLTSISIWVFLKYSLSIHIIQHKKELGILRTLGIRIRTINKMYYLEIISYLISVILVSLIILGIIWSINYLLIKFSLVEFIYLDLLNCWNLALLGLFFFISWLTLNRVLKKLATVETGNLIYGRDIDLL